MGTDRDGAIRSQSPAQPAQDGLADWADLGQRAAVQPRAPTSETGLPAAAGVTSGPSCGQGLTDSGALSEALTAQAG